MTVLNKKVGGIVLTMLCMAGFSNVAYGATSTSVVIPRQATNCNLNAPPDGAGENYVHGIYLFIYPREVTDNYTGCQAMWTDNGAKWMELYLEKGRPKAMQVTYPSDSGDTKFSCLYENDLLVNTDEKHCHAYEKNEPFGNLIFKSLEIQDGSEGFRKLKELQKKEVSR